MGGLLLAFILAVALAFAIARVFRLPTHWTGYVALGVLVAAVYFSSLLEAKGKPWTLWKRSWMQDQEEAEQRKLAKYTTEGECLKVQWEKLKEDLDQKRHLPGSRTVYLAQGRTIFEFGPSLYSRIPDLQARALAHLNENKELTPYQKEQMAYEMLLPEIVSNVSFFCAPSLKYGFWPYYTPTYYAATDDLRTLGEKTLAARAKKMLSE